MSTAINGIPASKRRRANLRGDIYVDLRINNKIDFLFDKSLCIFERDAGAELVIHDYQVNVGPARSAQKAVRDDSGEGK